MALNYRQLEAVACGSKINPSNRTRYDVEFVVVKEKLTPLIGLSASEQMKLLTVNECNLHRLAAVGVNDDFADVYD